MDYFSSLNYGETYHIYNKAVGDSLLFKSSNDYLYFMRKLKRFILPIADIYAYCLIPNHFHLFIKIKEYDDILDAKKNENDTKWITKKFSNLFISYTKSYNNVYKRQGRLFLQPFKRIHVEKEDYFIDLIIYIHRNPIHHGIVNEYAAWKYSSYRGYLSDEITYFNKTETFSYFGTLEEFIKYHEDGKELYESEKYLIDDI